MINDQALRRMKEISESPEACRVESELSIKVMSSDFSMVFGLMVGRLLERGVQLETIHKIVDLSAKGWSVGHDLQL